MIQRQHALLCLAAALLLSVEAQPGFPAQMDPMPELLQRWQEDHEFHELVRRQTAAPFPPVVYTTNYNTGSVAPSLQQAASTACAQAIPFVGVVPNAHSAEPYNQILASQGANTATNVVPPFATTATRQDTIVPLATTGTFTYQSAQPGVVLSSNTRPPYVTSGTLNLQEAAAGSTASSRSAAISTRPIKGEQYLALGLTLFAGLTTACVFLL